MTETKPIWQMTITEWTDGSEAQSLSRDLDARERAAWDAARAKGKPGPSKAACLRFAEERRTVTRPALAKHWNEHYRAVVDAIATGLPVPPEVREYYKL